MVLRISLILIVCVFKITAQVDLKQSPFFYPISSVDFNSSDQDLNFLKDILKDKQIVWLGEERHSDGTTTLAKSRIFKYLHEQMGFDILISESNLYLTEKIQKMIRKTSWDPLQAFATYSDLEYLNINSFALKKYLASNPTITFAGFDILYQSILNDSLSKDIEHAYKQIDINQTKQNELNEYFILFKKEYLKFSEEELNRYSILSAYFAEKFDSAGFFFLAQVLRSNNSLVNFTTKTPYSSLTETNIYIKMHERDKQMADNLLWCLEKRFPNKKVVVWSSNFHMLRNLNTIQSKHKEYIESVPMNEYVYSKYKDKMYCIAFIDGGGATGYIRKNKKGIDELPNPKKGSIEYLMKKTGYEYSFLNLTGISTHSNWLHQNNEMNVTFDDNTFLKADWSKIIDGVFFISEMRPDELKWIPIRFKMRDGEVPPVPFLDKF